MPSFMSLYYIRLHDIKEIVEFILRATNFTRFIKVNDVGGPKVCIDSDITVYIVSHH